LVWDKVKEEEAGQNEMADEVQTIMGSTFYCLMNEAEDRCHWRR